MWSHLCNGNYGLSKRRTELDSSLFLLRLLHIGQQKYVTLRTFSIVRTQKKCRQDLASTRRYISGMPVRNFLDQIVAPWKAEYLLWLEYRCFERESYQQCTCRKCWCTSLFSSDVVHFKVSISIRKYQNKFRQTYLCLQMSYLSGG